MTRTPLQENVLPEQVRLLYGQLKLGAVASVINAAVLCLILWQVHPPEMLIGWFVAVVVINLPRTLLVARYRQAQDAREQPRKWAGRLVISNVLSGAVWGAGAYLLFPAESLAHETFLAFILAGMAAGAAPLYSALRSAYAAFILPMLLPFAARLFLEGVDMQTYMGLLVLFYSLVLLISSRRIHATILESLELRFSNHQLLDTLTTARQQLEDGNRALQAKVVELEIAERAAKKSNAMLNAISHAQMRYIENPNLNELFDDLLATLLELTGSEYGFIGEVLRRNNGAPYLKTYALTNIAWNDETRRFYEQNAPTGMEFDNLSTLFGAVMVEGRAVISNTPASDARAGGLPEGHPALNAFLGVPFFHSKEMVGMVGVANRPGGYDESVIDELAPFLHTCASIIHGERVSVSKLVAEANFQKTAAELKAIHTQVADGIATLDHDGCFITVNPAVERMFDMSEERLQGAPLGQMLTNGGGMQWSDMLQDFLEQSQSGSSIEVEALRSDGVGFPLEITLSHMHLSHDTRLIAVLRDITERRKIERLKSEFIATVSHELRTPLTSIRGSLGLLRGGMDVELPEQATQMLDIAISNSDRLGLLINDLLDMEKIESGGMRFNVDAVPLVPLLNEAVMANQGYAQRFGVKLEIAGEVPDIILHADRDRVLQVLSNLLSNAVKFSGEGDKVLLSAAKKGHIARIEVQDFGPGIPDDFRDKVFDKFTQADASDTRAVGGTGLGLSISRAIIERMRGTIGFDSEPGAGSTFHFELPLVHAEH